MVAVPFKNFVFVYFLVAAQDRFYCIDLNFGKKSCAQCVHNRLDMVADYFHAQGD